MLSADGKQSVPATDLGAIEAPGSKAAADAGRELAAAAGGADSGMPNVAADGGAAAPVAREPARLVDRGFLSKRGRILKSWKQRWVLIRENVLMYFADEVEDADELDLEELGRRATGEVIPLDGPTYVSAQPKPKKPYRFCVEVEGRQLYLQAASQDDLDAWMESIKYLAAKARADAAHSESS